MMAKNLKKTYQKIAAIAAIREFTTPGIILGQKTSYSLNNFHIRDCKYKN